MRNAGLNEAQARIEIAGRNINNLTDTKTRFISKFSSDAYTASTFVIPSVLPKEVIQPHFPVRLPCYDFTLLTKHTFDSVLLAVGLPASGILYSDGVTGGVYKARERIHRAVLMRDY